MAKVTSQNFIEELEREEARARFEAALRGARIAGPKPNEGLTPKRKRRQEKRP